MNDNDNDNDNEKEDINNYYYEGQKNLETAEMILSHVVIIIDYILIFICCLIVKSKDKNMKLFKYKLYSLYFIDSILSLIYKILYNRLDNIPNELFFSLLYSCQFLIIICFFEQIIIFNKYSIHNKDNKNINPYQQSLIFLFITFSYDKLFKSSSKLIFILESLLIFKYIFKLYNYIDNKFNKIDLIIRKVINKRDNSYGAIMNSPFFFFIFVFVYYWLKLLITLIQNSVIIIFIKMINNAIRMAIKLLVFTMLVTLIYVFDKVLIKEEQYKLYSLEEEKLRLQIK